MRQNIRQLLLLPIGFCMVSGLFEPTIGPIPSAFAATGDPPISTASPTPNSRLLSRMPALKRLATPLNPIPAIALNSLGLSFTSQQGNSPPPPQVLTVNNRGGGRLSWNATTNTSWLTLSHSSGTGNGTVTISPVTSSLGVGTHTGNITVSAPGAQPVSIPVTFIVTPPVAIPPVIGVSASSLSFTTQQSGSNPTAQPLSIRNTGGGTLTWTATDNAAWLTLSSTAGTGNGTITIAPVLGSLVADTYTGNITVSAPGAQPISIPVTFIVTPPANSLTLSSNSLAFTATQGLANPSSKTITVQSTGSWTATKAAPWLVLSQTSGSANGTITANVDTSKATQGENQATITVASGSIIKTVTITLTLNAPSSSSATLTWKANSETDLAGYKVYRSTISGRYEQANVVAMLRGNVTSYQATGLQSRTTYFFVVTAFDIAGNESGYSNEVSKSVY